jgi:hypothetical protein
MTRFHTGYLGHTLHSIAAAELPPCGLMHHLLLLPQPPLCFAILTVQVGVCWAEQLPCCRQCVLPAAPACIQLLDGHQELTELLIRQPRPADTARDSSTETTHHRVLVCIAALSSVELFERESSYMWVQSPSQMV